MTGAVQKPVYLDQIDHLMQVLTARGLPLRSSRSVVVYVRVSTRLLEACLRETDPANKNTRG